MRPAEHWGEIASLGRFERAALASRVQPVIEHLAKLAMLVAVDPPAEWPETVVRRTEIERLLRVANRPVRKRHAGE